MKNWRENQVMAFEVKLKEKMTLKDKVSFLVQIYNMTMIQRGEEQLDNFIMSNLLHLVGVESPIFYEISRQEMEKDFKTLCLAL